MDTALIVIFAVVALAIYFAVRLSKRRARDIEGLKNAYEAALKNKDKQQALLTGRRYYAALRGGNLSTFDEQAISNDINAFT